MCKEGLVEDEYHLLFTCSAYSAVCESYDDILRGGDDLHVTLKRIPRRLSSYVDALITHQDFWLQRMNIPLIPRVNVNVGLSVDSKNIQSI